MLLPCPSCRRHVREETPACPFCRTPLAAPGGSPLRGALSAGVLSLGVLSVVAGCGGASAEPAARETTPVTENRNAPDTQPEETQPDPAPVETSPAPEETAPPDRTVRPMYGGPPVRPPAPPPARPPQNEEERPIAAYGGPPMRGPGGAPPPE